MTDDENPPTPIAPLSEQPIDTADVMEYYAYSAADRVGYVKSQIEEREKAYFNLYLIRISLEGNPEPGPHREVKQPDGETDVAVAMCMCGVCELARVTKLLMSMVYAISKLKAMHASLS